MGFRFVPDEDERIGGSDIVGRYLAKKYIADLEKKEEDEKKKKEKNKGPTKISVGHCLLVLIALAPFVGMGMSALFLAIYVKWAEVMKALVNQL